MKKSFLLAATGLSICVQSVAQSTMLNHNWANDYNPTTAVISQGTCIADNSTYVFASGKFSGTVDFDDAGPILPITSSGTSDMYITCTDKLTGTVQWVRTIGGAGSGVELPRRMIVSGNSIVMVGQFTVAADFNLAGAPGSTASLGADDIFIVQYDVAGNYMWHTTYGSTGSDQGYGIDQSPTNGNFYVTGYFSGTVSFGGTAHTVTGLDTDGFIACYSSSWGFLWSNQIGTGGSGASTGNENVTGIRVHGNRIFVTGFYHTANCDFDPAGALPWVMAWGARDIFVASYDATSGAYFWHTTIGGSGLDTSGDLVLEPGGRLYIAANYRSATIASWPAGISAANVSPGTYNFLVANIVSSTGAIGAWNWGVGGGAAGDDVATSIEYDGTNVYVGGYYTGSVDFNPAGPLFLVKTSSGGYDMFYARYRQTTGFCTDVASIGSGPSGNDRVADMELDISGSRIFSTGTFMNTVDMDPDALGADNVMAFGANMENAFVAQYDYLLVPAIMLNDDGEDASAQTISSQVLGEDNVIGELQPLSYYPNPTNGIIFVDNVSENSTIEIYAMDGKLVYAEWISQSGRIAVDLAEWTNGIYVLNVRDADGSVRTGKIIKE